MSEADAAIIPFGMDKEDAKINELAQLSPLDYEKCREKEAKVLGARVSVLDKLVDAARPIDAASQILDEVIETLEPWPEPVDGAALAKTIHAKMCLHMTFADPADPVAATIWL